MVIFNSIIAVDTETTGLPHLECNNTHITEIALIGCEVAHLKHSISFPRVLHKLVLCFNPMKMILPCSSEITGLENEMLMNIKPFCRADVDVLKHFIGRLPLPVCIIAHNGNKFDFPILQKHIYKCDTQLPDYVYCADSLKAFQDIYPNSSLCRRTDQKFTNWHKYNEATPKKEIHISTSKIHTNIASVDMFKQISTNVIRELFPESSNKNNSEMLPSDSKIIAPANYKLSTIYEFLHNKGFLNSHRAEDDATALLSCVIKCGEFLNWMNENAVAFSSIKPLM